MYFIPGSFIYRSNSGRRNRHWAQKIITMMPVSSKSPPDAVAAVEEVYRAEWGRIVSILIGMVGGDFDLAEECAQEAFTAAVSQWQAKGVPEFPRAWIIQTARHKAIDRIRRQTNLAQKLEAEGLGAERFEEPNYDQGEIPDERLRLIFTCCHPALAPESTPDGNR